MGVLDEAIRQHLELKRAHGASAEELERQEQEALGPARRDTGTGDEEHDAPRRPGGGAAVGPEPRSAESSPDRVREAAPPSFEPTGRTGESGVDSAPGSPLEEREAGRVFDIDELAPRDDEGREAGAGPGAAAGGAEPVGEAELVGEDYIGEEELDEEELDEEELAEEELAEELARGAPGSDEGVPAPAQDEQPAGPGRERPASGRHAEAGGDEGDTLYRPPPDAEADTNEYLVDEEAAEGDFLEGEVAEDEVLAEQPVTEVRPLEEEDLLAEEDELVDDEAADADLPGEAAGEDLPREPEGGRQDRSATSAGGDAAEGEDVLEETPEFLQETPDDERLWFEQQPPRDFDLDR